MSSEWGWELGGSAVHSKVLVQEAFHLTLTGAKRWGMWKPSQVIEESMRGKGASRMWSILEPKSESSLLKMLPLWDPCQVLSLPHQIFTNVLNSPTSIQVHSHNSAPVPVIAHQDAVAASTWGSPLPCSAPHTTQNYFSQI